jgi:hypothetical protein
MPQAYAERLAKHLMADVDLDPYVVEIPNHGFHLEVADALRHMGYPVEVEPFRPILTIHQKQDNVPD